MRPIAEGYFSPGLYIAHPPGLWVRMGETRNLPSHLKRSKGKLAGSPLLVALGVLFSPFLSFVVLSGTKERTLAVVKGAQQNDEVVIFRADHVFRLLANSRTEEEIRLRRLWERWVSSSEEIAEKSTADGVAEKFVNYVRSASDTPPELRRKAVSSIADSYFSLSRNVALGRLADSREFIESRIADSSFSDAISLSLGMAALESIWEQPLVPMGSDNSADNCLIGDESFAFIDVEPMRVGFAAQHVLGVIAAWDHNRGHQILIDFLEGHLDDELKLLLGVNVPLDKASRFAWITMAVVLPRKSATGYWQEFVWNDSLFRAYGLQKFIPNTWLKAETSS